MKLTTAAAQTLLASLRNLHNADPAFITQIEALIVDATDTSTGGVTPSSHQVRYSEIKNYNTNLRSLFSKGITCPDARDEQTVTLMEKERVLQLLDHVPSDGYLAAVLSVCEHEITGKDHLSIALLAANKDKMPIDDHLNDTLPGEQHWKAGYTLGNASDFLK
jgi:hypothetical protein